MSEGALGSAVVDVMLFVFMGVENQSGGAPTGMSPDC
jgi:hypothetical protein